MSKKGEGAGAGVDDQQANQQANQQQANQGGQAQAAGQGGQQVAAQSGAALAEVARKVNRWKAVAAKFDGDEGVAKVLEQLTSTAEGFATGEAEGLARIADAVAASSPALGQVDGASVRLGQDRSVQLGQDATAAMLGAYVSGNGRAALFSERGRPFAQELAREMSFGGVSELEAAVARGQRGHFSSARLSDLLRVFSQQAAQRHGWKVAGLDTNRELQWQVALGLGRYHAAMGTGDFPELLGRVGLANLRAGQALAQTTWSQWCAEGQVDDFRSVPYIDISQIGLFQDVPEGREPENTSFAERKQSVSTKAKGVGLEVGWHALINDDLGAFTKLSQMIGYSYEESLDTAAYAMLALNSGAGPVVEYSGLNLFNGDASTGHTNLLTGAALSSTSMNDAVTRLANMKSFGDNDEQKRQLGMVPEILLVGTANWTTAQLLYTNEYEINSQQRNSNVYRNMARPVVSAKVSGGRWYLLSSPVVNPIMELTFLRGYRNPRIAESGTRSQWKMSWTAQAGYNANPLRHEGAVYNPGA